MTYNSEFLKYLTSIMTDEAIAQHVAMSVASIHEYRNQLKGARYLREHGVFQPGLRRHAIAFRHRRLTSFWLTTPDLQRARREYDEGKVELCQGLTTVHGQECWVLYSIPRRQPVKRNRPWFVREECSYAR